ncbi:tetratricopeptide repeat protein [Neobacillus mesonae]|nr:tetratricopeptide repeat protein [Neobacillus mesonae]
MKGKPLRTDSNKDNVIKVQLDASFFFERAVRELDRNQYGKALKYFRKAVEYEPDNPVNHCNMAGILSEMGDYAGSNEVLEHIMKHVDPGMTECYFYMANNFANMEQFEAAEEALVTYLEEDEQGHFLEDAEEMMELLYHELRRKPHVKRIKAREGTAEHDFARSLLEEGKFAQAAELLESITGEHPDFVSARNNLALAYYYMGRFQKAKEIIFELLEQEPGNLHALCNLAIFYQNEGNEEQVNLLVNQLLTLVPFEQEHAFKLGTTMGILGQHEAAYMHFQRILKQGDAINDPSLVHYTAVAACNTERYDVAKRLWNTVNKLDPESEVPKFYTDQLNSRTDGQKVGPVSYHYHLPFEEQFRLWEKYGSHVPEDIKKDPLIRSSFFWALNHGDETTKANVIKALRIIGDYEVQQALLSFLEEESESPELKEMALAVLREIGHQDYSGTAGESAGNSSHPYGQGTPVLKQYHFGKGEQGQESQPKLDDKQQAVINRALEGLSNRSDQLGEAVQHLWADYLMRVSPESPSIGHVEGWAAALEYLTTKYAGKGITYSEVAQRYEISSSTVSRYVKQIDRVCDIQHRVEHIFQFLKEKKV